MNMDESWRELHPFIHDFWQRVQRKVEARHAPGRLKQWLNLMRRNFPQAEVLYQTVRPLREPHDIQVVLDSFIGLPDVRELAQH